MSDDKPPIYRSVPLRGTYYRGDFAIRCARISQEGDLLTVIRDRNNSHDSNAIRVYYNETWIGFVAREYACDIAQWMDKGWYFICHVQDNYVCGIATHVHLDMMLVPIDRGSKKATTKAKKEIEHVE